MKVALPEITVLCVGSMKDNSLATLVRMYLKRLSHDVRITIKEIKDRRPKEERDQLLQQLSKTGGHIIALSEEGTCVSSKKFAQHLGTINRSMTFVIGGATGLHQEIKVAANELLSLSPLTFTHEMARVLLLEQIYRAISILHNRSYHKE